jgi:2-keto-4-pentenoate hydratase/2-oxohepta-3-ene-1,7-dioic acid hydratase in catechol pathway
MNFASFNVGGRAGWGAVVGDKVIELGSRLPYPTLRAAIAAGALRQAAEAAQGGVEGVALSAVELAVPVPDSGKVICIGRNYKGHVAEANAKLPAHPSLFIRMLDSFAPPGGAMVRPRVSEHMDFEGELALVIGTGGRHIAKHDALRHVAGYTCLNDGSIRDIQFEHSLAAGKNFFASGSFGPWMVPAASIPDPSALYLTTRLNGVEVQHTRTDDLIFDIPTIIAYVSAFTPLSPGDVIATGTPEGVGFARKPPLWLKPGDTIEVEITSIGVLKNTVTAEA